MGAERQPFNISLMDLRGGILKLMKPVTTLDIFENTGSTNFHDEGLFSTTIFGRVGDDERDSRFSYIELKTKILHPIVFIRLERLKRLYAGILSGKEHAVWDEQKKDFFPSNEIDGLTGYQFFMSHWKDIVLEDGDSPVRKQRVQLVNKFRDLAVTEVVLVMPAGLRDAEINSIGRVDEGEINPIYRRLISISNTIGKTSHNDVSVLDTARYAQQMAFNEIYLYIETMLSGKKGLIQDKVGSRRIFDGTRNVISAMDISAPTLNDQNSPGPDDTVLGLWQTSRGALPVTINALRNSIISKVFNSAEGGARLIDTKTLKSELVHVSPQTYDRWTTAEGLEKVVALQSMVAVRSRPVMIEGRYLALVYKPVSRNIFKIFLDIDDLPEWADKKDVYPISLEELIYLSNYRHWNDLRTINTRYPVTGEGSTYPSRVFVRTTVRSEARVELGDDWELLMPKIENTASVYPIFEPETYVDSMMVHPNRLSGLGGDYDGDMTSGNILYTKESTEEINRYLEKREAYVDPAGGLRTSANIDTTALVMFNMTG